MPNPLSVSVQSVNYDQAAGATTYTVQQVFTAGVSVVDNNNIPVPFKIRHLGAPKLVVGDILGVDFGKRLVDLPQVSP